MKIVQILRDFFRKNFLLGIIVLAPFVIAIQVFLFFFDWLNQIMRIQDGRFLYVIPADLHPDYVLGVHIPGLGLIATVLFILFVGFISRHYVGLSLIRWLGMVTEKVPGMGLVYKVVKQILDAYTQDQGQKFSRVVVIEYPRIGVYTLGFVTGRAKGLVQSATKEEVINVFVPTTPNPTSGFYMMVPEKDCMNLDITIEDAFKLIISGGAISPPDKETKIETKGK